MLVGIFIVYGIFFLGTVIRNNLEAFNFIGKAPREEHTVTVQGEGKVTVRPDVAETNMGMIAEGKTVAEAQQKNTEVMNKLLAGLKSIGIEDKDIQTANYTVSPLYDYTEGVQTLRGYGVSQDVRVKIRKVENANKVLGLAGEVGATNVSGLQFTIDDRETYVNEAREKALADARAKAQNLANQLGVSMVRVVGYDENEAGSYPGPMYSMMGDARVGEVMAAPSIESGSTEVKLQVRVTFEIR